MSAPFSAARALADFKVSRMQAFGPDPRDGARTLLTAATGLATALGDAFELAERSPGAEEFVTLRDGIKAQAFRSLSCMTAAAMFLLELGE